MSQISINIGANGDVTEGTTNVDTSQSSKCPADPVYLMPNPMDSASSRTWVRRRSILGPPSLFPSQKLSDPNLIIPPSVTNRRQSIERSVSQDLPELGTEPSPDAVASRKDSFKEQQFDYVAVTTADLDFYYGLVKRQILRYQSPTTGLFPEVSSDTQEGCIRSSIYANMAVWSLYQAYKRIDDDRGKSYELGQSTVLGLRGILSSWMRQSHLLEKFKSKQTPENALHSKFNLVTGAELYSVEQYNHLQIDIVSLYLLFLVQAITSGLQVIYTLDEVCFVQNLVYYVERAYRTPDFGMWEQGSKLNNGTCELNASSIGFAKAALEAISGCNLFGDRGASWSVIFVDIDAHNRNRSIFETLLPRESASKTVDAALVPTVSFPAFATHDKSLYETTMKSCIDSLEGKQGFKRFEWDGYGSILLDDVDLIKGRFYPDGLLQEFQRVESEWPLFFAYMVIDGVFKQKDEQVAKYLEKLRTCMCYNESGDPVFPKYYYVTPKDMEKERKKPGSCHRKASNNGCADNELFLWGQSMLIISDLLTTRLLSVHELDPIRRHLPSYTRPKLTNRYSAFEKGGGANAPSSDLVVQVVTIAESMRLQAVLATYGIQTQTPNEIEPVQIWAQSEMVKVYEHLGRNEHLGLNGRPSRPLGALGTSKIYRMMGQTVICYPLIFSASEFYLSHDMALLTADIKSELKFVSRSWRLSGRPTICLIVTENNMRDPQFPSMLALLSEFKYGVVDGVKVRLGRLQNLLATSCIEHLDFLQNIDPQVIEGRCFTQLQNEHVGYQTLTDIPVLRHPVEEERDFVEEFGGRPSGEIATVILSTTHMFGTIQLLGILYEREGGDYMVGDMSVLQRLEILNRKAGSQRHWAAVRYSSSLLRQMVDSISPFVTQILVSGKQVTVGTIGVEYSLFDKPMTPDEIRQAIYSKVQPFSKLDAVLQQELILYCGKLIATNPELFSGMLKVRIGWILYGLSLYCKMKEEDPIPLEKRSPSEIRKLLYRVLKESQELQLSYSELSKDEFSSLQDRSDTLTIYQVRIINGCLNRVPEEFYGDVWLILNRTPGGIYIGEYHIPQEPTLTQMAGRGYFNEESFAHYVESLWVILQEPEQKQLVVELFCVLAKILKRNPEIIIQGRLDSETLIAEAVSLFKKDQEIKEDEIRIFYNSPVYTTSGYFARAIVNNILKGSMTSRNMKRLTDYNCPVQ